MTITYLERLNQMLKEPGLGLPAFRCTVNASGGNLKWLKKFMPRNPKCRPELEQLLGLDMNHLLQEHGTLNIARIVPKKIVATTETVQQVVETEQL